VDVGAYGKDCDSTVFKNSSLWKSLQLNLLNILGCIPLSGQDMSMPYVFVADEGFALRNIVLRPFGGKHSSVTKRVFNYRLRRARRYVECTFGILSNKWIIYHRPINVSPDFAEDIVKACCMLHNFVLQKEGYQFEDTLEIHEFEDVQGGRSANDIRNMFACYFMSDNGAVPWQLSRI
jgi:hypothetical protein